MNLKKNLVLLGMMGSGKSTIGALISKKLKLKFVDIDKNIEKETNMKISEIFEKKGENFFRNIEEKITLKLLGLSNLVISLGGGGFVNDKIRKEVLNNNSSFWLNWSSQTLLNRIKNSKKRPIAIKFDNVELIELIEKRSKIYSKAKFKINCEKLTKLEISKKIIKLYEQK
jgi:shikimate kinase|tara:strand:+ start:142 stop:654 length:513 start_codon:yes stop_codon:yes gene_type:complete